MSSRTTTSAGIVAFREGRNGLEVLLVHPGGPFWRRKDVGSWSIPKGEIEPGEEPLAAALREASEELGAPLAGDVLPLGGLTQKGGKRVIAFALSAAIDADAVRSNLFTMEWPPRSGRMQSFPEIDRAAWFDLPEARRRILPSQAPFLDRLEEQLGAPAPAAQVRAGA